MNDYISNEDIGMRTFQVRKERAVERALEKIRQALGTDWNSFTASQIKLLDWTLGEVWAQVGRSAWEEFSFSSLTPQTAARIIGIGQQMADHKKSGADGIEQVQKLLSR